LPDEPIGGLIRLFQTTNVAGEPAADEFVREVRYEGLRSLTETVMDFLRPLSPRETEHPGVFWYTDPSSGSGWLRMEQFRAVNVDEVTQAVRVLQIDAAIGQSEPVRQEVLSFGNAVVNRTTNPYFKILFGVAVLALMAFAVVRMVQTGGGSAGTVVVIVILAAVSVPCIVLIVQGLRRRAWWHRARAEARRQGVSLPDQLKTWN
jgi:hypothetical protein